jgi:CheY-like chemotaxis protein
MAAKQARVLYQRMGLELGAQLAVGLAIVAGLATGMSNLSLGAWFLSLGVVVGLRFLLARAFAQANVSNAGMAGWHLAAVFGTLVTGVVWGLLGMAQIASPAALGTTLVGVGAISGICLYCMATSRSAFLLFLTAATAPWLLELLQGKLAEPLAVSVFLGFEAIFVALFMLVHSAALETARSRNESRRAPRPAPTIEIASTKTQASTQKNVPTRQALAAMGDSPPPVPEMMAKRPTDLTALASDEAPLRGRSLQHFTPKQDPAAETAPVGRRILLVEDNPDNQLVALHLLQRRGFHAVVANNGREALALIEKQQFDLILMDLQMPEMGGLEATAAIRLREKGSNGRIPIIALTAHASAGDREICLAAGMDDHVAKPINRAKLFAAIDAQLSSGKNKAR